MAEPDPSIQAFDYDLPTEAIAQRPVEPRDAARLLVDAGPDRSPEHRHVRDLPDLVGPGDVIVVNDTRVRPARLRLRKATGGAVEVLLLEPDGDDPTGWQALVRPGRRVPPGTVLVDPAEPRAPLVEVGASLGEGRRHVHLVAGEDAVLALGEVPLPPYIHEPLADPERYQTVYGDRPTSVAAPTAGLHLTTEVLDRCREAGAAVATVELAVGLGTFRLITVDDVRDHHVHRERYRVPADTLAACDAADRVVAIGTTAVRALESAAATGELEGSTDLYVRRGHRFAVVGALLTNFHVPRSSLLVLVDAFVGSRWRSLYEAALAERYRFFSFGDAMFLPGPPLDGAAPR
ncbi:MAG TPA: tRNA preQ1(34) S-adenosylmethionine ribosyltransferase-isomerase QueA [Acidimicrobiales bacterium]|nr:tRNA preQ1(34) S-adenosylmethionine ribosyltransferase-isomerase QueA [Acidimicrobiales bacterium]